MTRVDHASAQRTTPDADGHLELLERHILGAPAEPAVQVPAPPVLATLNGAVLPSARLRRRQGAAAVAG